MKVLNNLWLLTRDEIVLKLLLAACLLLAVVCYLKAESDAVAQALTLRHYGSPIVERQERPREYTSRPFS